MKEEDKMSDVLGKPVRITYIDVDQVSRLMDWSWSIDIRAKKEEDSKLEKLSYIDSKQRVAQLF